MNFTYDNEIELFLELYEILKEQKNNGKKIIAYIAHEYIPPELISACGAFPLPLIFAGNEDTMTIGGDYLTPTTCVYARSIIGMFQLKEQKSKFKFLNLVDSIISSNYCTADLLTVEAISKNFNIPIIEYFIPTVQSKFNSDYYLEQLTNLKSKILDLTHFQDFEKNIVNEIKKYQSYREKLSDLPKYKIKASEKIKIFQKALLFGPDYYDLSFIKDFEKEEFTKKKTNNIILSGCPCFIGDDFTKILEESGVSICYNDTWVGNIIKYHSLDFDVKEYNNPLEYFIDVFEKNIYSYHLVPNSIENNIEKLKEISTLTGSNFIINHILKFCDIIGFQRQDFKELLKKENLKILNLERDYGSGMRGQLSTRIEAFLEVIKD